MRYPPKTMPVRECSRRTRKWLRPLISAGVVKSLAVAVVTEAKSFPSLGRRIIGTHVRDREFCLNGRSSRGQQAIHHACTSNSLHLGHHIISMHVRIPDP